MSYKNYLIFDFGASNGRAIVAKFDGEKADIQVTHRFENRSIYASDTLYFNILRLFSELKIGILSSIKKYKNIASMGIDTWASDFGFIDKNGKLISNVVHYRDRKRHNMAKKLFNIIPKKELFKLTGGIFLTSLGLFHIFSLKLQNATELLNAYKFLMIPDIFNYFLTGELFNEFTNATTTLMYNQVEKKWEDKILNKIGISKDIFCQIIMPGAKIGNIQKSVSNELEINPIPVIAPATHDTSSAIAGVPVIDKNKNYLFNNIGTWCIAIKETSRPVINDEVFRSGYANEAGVGGINMLYKNITGLWIIQQCRKRWVKDKGEDISWDEIVSLSSSAVSFKFFIDVDNPIFSQIQINMPDIIRQYCRDKNQSIPEDISILGFDDIEWAKYSEPALTTIHQKRKRRGKIAVEKLLKNIKKNKIERSVFLDTYIVERNSVKSI